MLILPPGHAEAIRVRRALSTREKRMIGGVLATVAAIVVVLVVALSAGDRVSGHGCIYLTVPANAMTGAEEIYQCGATARATCASALAPGAFARQSAQRVATECRKAGLPVG